MANTLITPPEVDKDALQNVRQTVQPRGSAESRQEYVPNLGEPAALQSTNPFQSMIQNVRDAFFPEKLPPLVLESTPIAVADPMAVKRDPVSTGIAVGFHVLAFLLIFWISARAIKIAIAQPKQEVKTVSFDTPPPPPLIKTPPAPQAHGGGGQHDIAPVSHGAPPKFSPVQIVPPSAPPKIPPKLAVAPTIDVDKINQMKSNLPNIGMIAATNPGVSMGNGHGSGLGSGDGNGMGPGSGHGTGGGDYAPGVNGVSYPKLIYQVDPEFSEEARKAKFQGEVIVHLVVDASGHPTRVSVSRPIGMGLDEKAKEAVSQYRFKPAMKDGHPVPVLMDVAVNFQIF